MSTLRTTRPSLTATAVSTRYVASLLAGTGMLSTSLATTWVGDTSNDWNDNLNWSGDAGTGGTTAAINSTSPFPIISANIPATPVDINVGVGAFTGRLDHINGTAQTGNGSWMRVGTSNAASNGTYNLTGGAAGAGTFTGQTQGSGSMTVGNTATTGRLYVGGDDAGSDAGTGVVNVHTTGSLVVRNDVTIGAQGGTGTFNLDSGTVTSGSAPNNGWTYIGRTNGIGTMRMSGGSYTQFGRVLIGDGGSSQGTLRIDGGTFTKNTGEAFFISNGGTSQGTVTQNGGTVALTAGEIFIGQGSNTATGIYNLNGGSVSVANWINVGRQGSQGTLNIAGGTMTKTGTGGVAIGTGNGATGTVNHSAGLLDVQSGSVNVGRSETATGNYNLTGGTLDIKAGALTVADGAGNTGNVNLDGGTLRTQAIDGGLGNANVDFNGTQIIALQNRNDFINDLDTADIEAGGLLIDSNGFNLIVPASLQGTGNVVKSGAGTLILLSTGNNYSGDNLINAGQLVLAADQLGSPDSIGSVTVADGASFGVTALFPGGQLVPANVSFGTTAAGTTFNANVGNVSGFNPTDPLVNVSGALSVADGSTVTVNVTGEKFTTGDMPLLSYVPGSRTGTGTFSLGTLPNGVVATLVDDPNYMGSGVGMVYLDVTSVSLPRWNGTDSTTTVNATGDTTQGSADIVVFDATGVVAGQYVSGFGIAAGTIVTAVNGTTITVSQAATITATGSLIEFTTPGSNDGQWNTSTANWTDQITLLSSTYADPDPVLFDDSVDPVFASVTLGTTAMPSDVLFNNALLNYTLQGTGTIGGSTGLTKQGGASLTIACANSYTGTTTIRAGTVNAQGNQSAANGGWTINPNSDATTTVNFAAGSTIVAGSGKTILIGSSVGGGFDTTVNVAGSVANDGTLTLARRSFFNVNDGGTWTQTGNMSLNGVGGFSAAANIQSGGSFDYTGSSTIKLEPTLGNSGSAVLTLNGGTFTTFRGFERTVGTSTGNGTVTLQNGGTLRLAAAIPQLATGGVRLTTGAAGGNVDTNGFSTEMSGPALGAAGQQLNKTGSGTLTLSGSADNAGLRAKVSAGTLVLGKASTATVHAVGSNGNTDYALEIENGIASLGGTGSDQIYNNSAVNMTGGVFDLAGLSETFDGLSGAGGTISNGSAATTSTLTLGQNNSAGGPTFGGLIANGVGTVALAKVGTGTQTLSGSNTYTGTTTVSAGTLLVTGSLGGSAVTVQSGGTLGGTGSVAGPVSVDPGGAISPGTSAGTFTAGGNVTILGTYLCEIDGANADRLDVSGTLTIPNAPLSFSVLAAPTAPAYIIATYGSLTGTFVGINVPAGYEIQYNYQGGNQIALVQTATPYSTWASGYGLDPLTNGAAGADPDADGQANNIEFAFGGDPTDGGNNAKIYSIAADSDAPGDPSSAAELLLTIAVRAGAPAFTGSPSPTATHDGFTYSVQGSLGLASFAAPVSVVPTPVPPASAPTPPAGYVYRTFSLDGSDGLPSRGFLRAQVTP